MGMDEFRKHHLNSYKKILLSNAKGKHLLEEKIIDIMKENVYIHT